MIDYNKTKSTYPKCVSIKPTTLKRGQSKKIVKISKENKKFLKLIGLRK